MEILNSISIQNTFNSCDQISVTGDIFSGKSVICAEISKKLGYEVFSIGALMRKEAEEKGLNIVELTRQYELSNSSDMSLDRKSLDVRSKTNLVIDARLGWFFFPESFKVFLTVDDRVILERLKTSNRGAVEKYASSREAIDAIHFRKNSEIQRLNKLYYINYSNSANYDLIIDTSDKTIEEVTNTILHEYLTYMKSKLRLFQFNNLMPTKNVKEINTSYIDSVEMEPVKVIKRDNFYWIKDGHYKVVKCMELRCKVPCEIVEDDGSLNLSISNINAWEDAFKFKYIFYPDIK